MTLNEYFTKVLCINLNRRTDRWGECVAQFKKFGIECERFEAHDMPGWGNDGCTASHRGCLELICHHKWERTLILEDDFQIVHEDFNERFSSMIGEVPESYSMFYIGGHFAEKPLERVSPHVIRMGRMMTTSSYAVTLDFARSIAPKICGTGPIDTLYYQTHMDGNCYILDPRLMIQRAGYSDLQQHVMDNGGCMLDGTHAAMV